ncbi:MAG: hypothetical protein Q8R28_22865 [Dehalococcoidia bacterium]|nr:hypothetical protein [Dehalococcoidia bacterium]
MLKKLLFIVGLGLLIWAVVRTLEERYRYLDLEDEAGISGPDSQ